MVNNKAVALSLTVVFSAACLSACGSGSVPSPSSTPTDDASSVQPFQVITYRKVGEPSLDGNICSDAAAILRYTKEKVANGGDVPSTQLNSSNSNMTVPQNLVVSGVKGTNQYKMPTVENFPHAGCYKPAPKPKAP